MNTFNEIARVFDRTRRVPWRCALEITEDLLQGIILDAGCGNGRHTILLATLGYQVVGIDISSKLIAIAREKVKELSLRDNVEFIVCDIRFPPFRENVFDGVLLIAVIHHIPGHTERILALRNIANVTKPGSRLIITAWSIWNIKRLARVLKFKLMKPLSSEFGDAYIPWRMKSSKIMRFYHLFSLRKLKKNVKEAGLDIIKSYSESKKYWFFPENLIVIARKPIYEGTN